MKLLNLDARFWSAIFNHLSGVSMTPEIRAQIDSLRSRIAAKDPTLTLEDMAIAVNMYREARGAVSSNIEAKKAKEKEPKVPKIKKAKAEPKSADSLLNDFLGGSGEQTDSV